MSCQRRAGGGLSLLTVGSVFQMLVVKVSAGSLSCNGKLCSNPTLSVSCPLRWHQQVAPSSPSSYNSYESRFAAYQATQGGPTLMQMTLSLDTLRRIERHGSDALGKWVTQTPEVRELLPLSLHLMFSHRKKCHRPCTSSRHKRSEVEQNTGCPINKEALH